MACWNKEENNMDSKVSPNERRFCLCHDIFVERLWNHAQSVWWATLPPPKKRSHWYEVTLHHLGSESKQLKCVILNTPDNQPKATPKVEGLNLLHFRKGISKIWLLLSPTQTMLWYFVQYIRKAICLRGWRVNALNRLDEFQDYCSKAQALPLQRAVKWRACVHYKY